MLCLIQVEDGELQKVRNWVQLRDLIKTIFLNADRPIVQANRHNNDWLIEYVTWQLCMKGYYTDKRQNTIIKLCNRHLVYYYDLKPELDALCKQYNITLTDVANYLKYASIKSMHSATRCDKLSAFIAGIRIITDHIQKDHLKAS